MGRALWRTLLLLAGAIWLSAVLTCAPAEAQSAAPYRPDEVIVKYRAQAKAGDRATVLARVQALTLKAFTFIDAELVQVKGMSVEEAIARLRTDPMVEYAEPNYELHALVLPDDPHFPLMYGLQNTGQTGGTPGADIRAPQAWDLFTGDPDLKIGVIDTGVDYTHPDLAANIWTNTGEIPGNRVDDDGNGYVDDVHGYDFANDDSDPFDDNGHGTHCAGTIAAVGNNGLGVVGVNWNAKVVAIKFLGSGGSGSTAAALGSVQYAIRTGVRLTSNSWGGGEFSQALLDAINAAGEGGQMFVAAAGNAAVNVDIRATFPVSYDSPYIIGVAATDHNDQLAAFSNWGEAHVHLAAPGVSILSTLPGDSYGLLSGTSMATPLVSGALAFVLGRFPGMSATLARSLMLQGVDLVPGLEGIVSTGGRLNLFTPVLEPDSILPARITDLTVIDRSSNGIEIGWTASGDDSITGRAVRYDLRRSTVPITDANFASATPVPGPNPAPSGTPERLEVRELDFNTTYYLAIRAVDEFSNAGPISNVVSATTLGIPDVTANPSSFFQELLTGAAGSQSMTIRNDGAGTLDWTIPVPELLTTLSPPQEFLPVAKGAPDPRVGVPVIESSGGPDAFGYRWSDSDQSGGPTFGWIDITGVGSPVGIGGDDATSQPVAMGMAFPFYGNTFSTVRVCSNGFLSFTDPSAPFSNQPLPNPGAPANMIAPMWDDLFIGVPSRIYTHFDGVKFIVSWEAIDRYGDGGPYTFQVLLFPSGEIRFHYLSLGPPTDNATVGIQNGTRNIGLTTAFNTAYLRDGLAVRLSRGPDWLGIEPRSGRLTAGQSALVTLRFSAVEALGGDYNARVEVRSNDPDEGNLQIPVTMRVIGAPDMVVEGVERTVASTRVFAADGAATTHTLRIADTPAGAGLFELFADGDYGDPTETASLTVEGRALGQVGGAGGDCALSSGTFPVDEATLAGLVADGEVRGVVQNTAVVSAFCVLNRHTVRLRYRLGADPLDFTEVFLNTCRAETLVVRNRGTDSLRVTSLEVSDALYTVSPSSFVLGVGDARRVVVTFCPPDVGDRPAVLTVHCNDPDNPVETVTLRGRGVVPPDIGVSPPSLAADLLSGETASRLLRVQNTGGSDLRFDVTQNTPAPAAAAPGPRPSSWVRVAGDDPPSHQQPAGYVAERPSRRTAGEAGVLLIMDEAPWGTMSDQQVLAANDIAYDLIPTSELAATELDRYRVILVASDQPTSAYSTLAAQAGRLADFVAAGGTLEYHAAGWGWSRGDASIVPLPGGVRIHQRLADQNQVLRPSHPVVAGIPSPFPGTSASHAFLSGLPVGALAVVGDMTGNVTLAEYRHGLGVVLVSCHTLEFGFASGQPTGVILRNLIPYAFQYSPPWLGVEPARGTIAAGASLDLDVRIETAALLSGTYRGTVRINSNDPDEPQVAVPVDLHVTGVPDIALSTTALDFGTQFIGVARTDTVRIGNPGTDTLQVGGVTVDDTDYTADGAGFELAPGATRNLIVRFLPHRAGPIEATLRIASNDPDEGVATVALHATGLEPPIIAAGPDSLSAALLTGQSARRTLTVSNSGGSPLTVEVTAVGRVTGEAAARLARRHGRGPVPQEGPPWVPDQPTLNTTRPSRGPVVTSGDYQGQHLRFGITDYGEIMPFQQPLGNEHLAVGSFLSGYTVAYQAEGADHVAFAGYETRIGIVPVSYREISNTPGLLVVETVTRTGDARLQITRTFTFVRSEKGIRVRTTIEDLSADRLEAVVFKEWADWDVDGDLQNTWDYDRERNMAYARRDRVAAIAGAQEPDVLDINGWNDTQSRATAVEIPNGPYVGDGLEVLHYEVGDLEPLQSWSLVTAHAVGDSLPELQQVVDRTLLTAEWLTFDPATLEVPAGGSRDVAVVFDPGALFGGAYDLFVNLISNDPSHPLVQVPAHLDVVGVPDITVQGAQVELASIQPFSGDEARTFHALPISPPPTGTGTVELVVDGDFGDNDELASLTLEGSTLGSAGGAGPDCTPARGAFALSAATLAALAADGVIQGEVRNTVSVTTFCAANRHTLRVRYRLPADALRFERLYVGEAREMSLAVRNTGTDHLTLGAGDLQGAGFALVGTSLPATLGPGEEMAVTVRFQPEVPCAACTGTLTLTTNDPDEGVVVVALEGSALPPPDIQLSPASIVSTLAIPAAETRTLTIANPGESELSFTITPAAPAPGPAAIQAGARPPDVRTSTGEPRPRGAVSGERDTRPLAAVVQRQGIRAGSVLVIADSGTETDVTTVLTAAGFTVTQGPDDSGWNGTNPSPAGFDAVVLLDGVDLGDDMPVGGQQALTQYVQQGGGLILTEWISYEVENGRYAQMRSLVPLTRSGGEQGTYTFGVTQNHPVTDGVSSTFTLTVPLSYGTAGSGTPVVTRLSDGSPMVIVKELGEGRLVHFAAAGNFDGARPFSDADMQRLLVNATDWAARHDWLVVHPSVGTVPAGGSVDVEVRIDTGSLVPGVYRDSVVVATNDPDERVVIVPVTLNASVHPEIEPAVASMEFGPVFVGQGRTQTLQIRNLGMMDLDIASGSVSGPGYALVGATFPIRVGPAGLTTLSVRFTPEAPCAPCAGALALASNDADEGTLIVPLAATAVFPPEIGLNPAAVLDTVAIPATHARALEIRNDGPSPLVVSLAAAAADSGAVPPWLTVVPEADTVEAGASTSFQVTFTTAGLLGGTYSASLRVISNDPDDPTLAVPVGLVAVGTPDIAASPLPLVFGAVFIGLHRDLSLTLTNAGSDTLEIVSGSTGHPAFSLLGTTFPILIAPAGETRVTVRFQPTAPCDPCSTRLLLGTNDPDEDPFGAPLTAIGRVPPDAANLPAMVQTAAATTLGPVPMVRTRTVRIDNTGGSDLEFSTLAISTTDSVTMYEGLARTKDPAAPADAEEPDPRPGVLGSGGPDHFGYRWRDSDAPGGPRFEWVDITGTGILQPLAGDEGIQTSIDIGFAFPFYGFQFRRVNMSTNGFLSFTSASTSPSNEPLPNPLAPNTLLAPFWDDLDFGSGVRRAWTRYDGVRFVVTWDNVPRRGGTGPYTFQVILYPTGRIVYQYLSMRAPLNSATVGIQNNQRNDGLTVAFNTAYVHDSLAVEIYNLPRWLTATPLSGSIPPGGSAELDVQFDAHELPDGDYAGNLAIFTNDPDESTLLVPCALHVGVMTGALDVDPGSLSRYSNDRWVAADLEAPLGLDPHDIAPGSVRLQRKVPIADGAPTSFGDNDGDGVLELNCKFDRERLLAMLPDEGEVSIEAIGEIPGVSWFQALDVVRLMPPGMQVPALAESVTAASERSLPTQLGFRNLGENPIRGDARLELALPERARVDVEIYDVQGAMVRRLAARTMEPGWHTLAWDGRDDGGRRSGAGVYFVRMAAGGRRVTVRLALVR